MADTYNGPATIVLPGTEIPVTASLRIEHFRGRPGWNGTLSAEPTQDFWDVTQNGGGRLRIPDGREGDFIPSRTSVGSGRISITGSGPAPF